MIATATPLPRFAMPGGGTTVVSNRRADVADRIDVNHDGVLTDDEIRQYMSQHHILKDPRTASVNEPEIMRQFKNYLADTPRDDVQGYHTYQQMADELQSLATQYPTLCQRVSLGKTHEGRDIWALKMSGNVQSDTSKKPGVVFTGLTHAREWMTIESPLKLAHTLLDGYATDPKVKQDVDSAEIWVVPCVNPDGYEYSRTQDAMWRKNRQPIDNSVCQNPSQVVSGVSALPPGRTGLRPVLAHDGNTTIGVDVNRNYDDGNPAHESLYRPSFDQPCRTDDDYGETSDDPNDETFRGPKGASELEVQAMLKLELGRPNIIGVIDHHSYGNDILRPWGHTRQDPDRLQEYLDCGNAMTAAMDQPYKLEASDDMYPTTGDATDCLHGAGITAYTIEMGDSFQPDSSQIPSMTSNVVKADMAFLEWIIQHKTGVTRQPLASIPPYDANSG